MPQISARLVPLLFAPALLLAAPVDDLVEYRVRVMESAHRQLQAASSIAVDGVPLTHHLAAHARSLKTFSTLIPELFPPGSRTAKSEAKPEIWQRWDDFIALAHRLGDNADALERAARDGNRKAMAQAYRDTLDSCRACHREFRLRQ